MNTESKSVGEQAQIIMHGLAACHGITLDEGEAVAWRDNGAHKRIRAVLEGLDRMVGEMTQALILGGMPNNETTVHATRVTLLNRISELADRLAWSGSAVYVGRRLISDLREGKATANTELSDRSIEAIERLIEQVEASRTKLQSLAQEPDPNAPRRWPAILLKTDSTHEHTDSSLDFAEVYKQIGCGTIELVEVKDRNGVPWTLYCDENALLNGNDKPNAAVLAFCGRGDISGNVLAVRWQHVEEHEELLQAKDKEPEPAEATAGSSARG